MDAFSLAKSTEKMDNANSELGSIHELILHFI